MMIIYDVNLSAPGGGPRSFMDSRKEKAADLYDGKMISGPMVRGSVLPFRLACLRYGADTVYSPALTDISLIKSTKQESETGIRLYSESNGHNNCIFHTVKEEKDRLVCQIVSVDGPNASQAALKLHGLASAIDINCGCPESFAVHRGGGSAMTLERAVDVVSTIQRNTDFPVSVKMRVESDIEKSIQFAKAVESAGALAITIHGRKAEQKRKGEVNYQAMKQVFEGVSVYKVGNGGIKNLLEAKQMKEETGCTGVMIATAALQNPSVFYHELQQSAIVTAEMARIAKQKNVEFRECKWTLTQPVQSSKALVKQIGPQVLAAQSWEEFDAALQPAL